MHCWVLGSIFQSNPTQSHSTEEWKQDHYAGLKHTISSHFVITAEKQSCLTLLLEERSFLLWVGTAGMVLCDTQGKLWGWSFKMSYLSLFQAQKGTSSPVPGTPEGFIFTPVLGPTPEPVGLEVLQHFTFCSPLHSRSPCAAPEPFQWQAWLFVDPECVSGWDLQGFN